jgi:hypothetical protein
MIRRLILGKMRVPRTAVLLTITLAVYLLVGGSLLYAGSGSFQTHVDFSTGRGPGDIAIGDFNHDGIPDLAVGNRHDNTVGVLLGKGNGTFSRQVIYSVANDPAAIAVGDINNDGNLDIVATSYTGGAISVLLGNGDGTFLPYHSYSSPCCPQGIVLGDFNGDGNLDVIVPDYFYSSITVHLGNGDGTFQTGVDYPAGSTPVRIVAADFNGDGKLDVATSDFIPNGTVSIFLGNGDGTFKPHIEYPCGPSPIWLAVGDINGDGKADLFTANWEPSGSVSVLIGNGDSSFQSPVNYDVASYPYAVNVGDFNGDGRLDVASANGGTDSNSVSVLLGSGDGRLHNRIDYSVGTTPYQVGVAELNGDGAQDIVVPNYGGSNLSVLLNSGGTRMRLSSSANPSTLGEPVTFSLTVKPTFATVGVPSGSVKFMDGTNLLGVSPLVSGQASFTTAGLSEGDHTINAIYTGDAIFNRHKARPLIQVVQ